MQKQWYIFNLIWLFIYLWITATLPLHNHQQELFYSSQEQFQDEQYHTNHVHNHSEDTEDCMVCLNLHIPFAIDNFDIINITPNIKDVYVLICQVYVLSIYSQFHFSYFNKGPPFSIIS